MKQITFVDSELWSVYSEKQAALFRKIEFLQRHQNSDNLSFKKRCSQITPDVLFAMVQELCEMEKNKNFYCGKLNLE